MLAAIVFAGVALAAELTGTEGRETIIGTADADTISALGADDKVYAIGGGERLDANNDPVYDVVRGQAGGDRPVGDNLPAEVREKLGFTGEIGVAGNDKLFGGKGPDRLFGNEGDDILNAGQEEIARHDELTGGRGEAGGKDVFWVDDASFKVYASGQKPTAQDADVILDLQEGEEIHNVDVEGAEPIIWPPSQ
jgi:Ca2+-binding RTX toxin-like protein